MSIVAVVGVGVTGARVADLLATNAKAGGALRLGIVDQSADVAARVARSVSGVVIDLSDAMASDLVVLAQPAPHAELARRLVSNGVSVVSMSDDVDDVRAMVDLDHRARVNDATLVVGAAMAPGLSGLLARHLASQLDFVDEIHVAMHGTGGPACARQHHSALGGTSLGYHDGAWMQRPAGAGRELCWFPEPVNSYDCYRAEMPDPLLLHRMFPNASRLSARMSATRRDRFTARLPMLRPPHKEGGLGALRVEVRGALATGERETFIAGAAVRSGVAAAIVAATTAGWVLHGSPKRGLVLLGDADLPNAALLASVQVAGVRMFEFTGVAR
jgi:saccharopine dehydrogenase-like NADP-dependent oxidoreductase